MPRAAANPLAARDGWICSSPKKTRKTTLIKKDNRVPARCMGLLFLLLPFFLIFSGLRVLWSGCRSLGGVRCLGWGCPEPRLGRTVGLCLPAPRSPGGDFSAGWQAGALWAQPSAQPKVKTRLGLPKDRQELSSPWPSARGSSPSQTCPIDFGASPAWLHATSGRRSQQSRRHEQPLLPTVV